MIFNNNSTRGHTGSLLVYIKTEKIMYIVNKEVSQHLQHLFGWLNYFQHIWTA